MTCSCWPCNKQTGHDDLSPAELQSLCAYSINLNGGRLIVQGLFARADCLNTNGRVYPKAILQREVARFKEQHVRAGTALGELNHPSYFSSYFRHLNLPNVSHQVLDLRWRGPELWGTLQVLPTPAGLLLAELYSKGIKLGVSSRGWASVVTDPRSKQVIVEPDYQLITFDFVPEPSNAGAYMVPIRKRYRKRIPDQSAAVAISFMGIGSISMANLRQLPPTAVLRKWLKHTSRAMDAALNTRQVATSPSSAAAAPAPCSCSGLAPPPAAVTAATPGSSQAATAGASMLDALGGCSQVLPADTPLGGGVVLGCHYQVLQKPWLPLDSAVRQFKLHLSLMATKARLHQQQQQLAGPDVQQQQQQPQRVQQPSQPRLQQVQQQQQDTLGQQQVVQQQRLLHLQQHQQQLRISRTEHLEQPLLSQSSDASSSAQSSQQLATVSGVHLPPGMLLHIACDEQHSDSSLGPGTPKSRGQLQLQAMQPQLSDV